MSSIIKVNTVQDTDGNNIINENANTITIGASGDTITIPSGATIANNGTATGFSAIDWQSTIVTGATHTASANQGLWIDTTSNACTITLPSSASVGCMPLLISRCGWLGVPISSAYGPIHKTPGPGGKYLSFYLVLLEKGDLFALLCVGV